MINLDNLAPYDLKILKHINQFNDGVSQDELIAKFGSEVLDALGEMDDKLISRKTLQEDYYNMPSYQILPFPTGNWMISDEGKLLLKRLDSISVLTNKQKWGERSWGLVSGFIIGAASGLLVGLNYLYTAG
jgi:hypothetical protein